MFNINWDASIDPSSVKKSIIRDRDVAVVLSVDHGRVASNIEACENIIMPYLIISNESPCI